MLILERPIMFYFCFFLSIFFVFTRLLSVHLDFLSSICLCRFSVVDIRNFELSCLVLKLGVCLFLIEPLSPSGLQQCSSWIVLLKRDLGICIYFLSVNSISYICWVVRYLDLVIPCVASGLNAQWKSCCIFFSYPNLLRLMFLTLTVQCLYYTVSFVFCLNLSKHCL